MRIVPRLLRRSGVARRDGFFDSQTSSTPDRSKPTADQQLAEEKKPGAKRQKIAFDYTLRLES